MSKLYVTEYARLADDEPGRTIQAGQEPALAEWSMSITGSSAQSGTFNPQTRVLMVHTDTVCHLTINENPIANSTKRRLPADTTVFYGIPNNKTLKLAVISGT